MKKKLLILFSMGLLLFSALSLHSFSDDTDPLISKSYFDKKIEELEEKIKNSQGSAASGAVAFKPLNFSAGDTIIFKEGTEFILRSGEAKIIDPTGNGLADITNGSNLINGSVLPTNHNVLCPRSDNRGIYCDTEVWVMIKGSYSKEVLEKESKVDDTSKKGNLNNDDL